MPDLFKIVTQFRRGILGRRSPLKMCYAVCWPLHGYLNIIDIECALTEGKVELTDHNKGIKISHYWITLPDGQIIDPTASQFNFNMPARKDMPDVYIGAKPEWYLEKKSKRKS